MRLFLAKTLVMVVNMILIGALCSGLAWFLLSQHVINIESQGKPLDLNYVILGGFLIGAVVSLFYTLGDKDFREDRPMLWGRVLYRKDR